MNYRNALPLALLTSLVFAAACTETTTTTAPEMNVPQIASTGHPRPLASLTCTASIHQRAVACALPDDGLPAGATKVLIGGQNQYIKLTSSNVQIVADSFTFDMNVTNLIPQPIGTTNGSSADVAGIRVFFNSGPTSTTSGTITVANPDGIATFTAASQPYFQYNSLLAQNAVSSTKRLKLQFTPEVTNFTFTLLVSAEVQYPNGYIDGSAYVYTLNPNESRTLPGTVRTFLGDPASDQTINWSTSAPGTASVTGTQVTAGSTPGFATLTGTAGARPAIYSTAVSVCQSTVVANNTDLPSSITSSDCFSSYGDANGRPTTSYYADLFRISLTAGQTVTVTMDSGDNLDTYLLLADGGLGFLVAGNDDDDTGVLGVGSRMVYTATTSGVYVIEASTFNGLDSGNYTLHVTVQ
jgi:hypothetical protein